MKHLVLTIAATAAAMLSWSLAPAQAQAGQTVCAPGEAPRYVFGFADLKAQIGDAMGDPVTCEFPDPNGTGESTSEQPRVLPSGASRRTRRRSRTASTIGGRRQTAG